MVALMSANGRLNNGKSITYAMGIAADSFMGQKRLLHNGALAGYRTIISVFPELRIAIFAFANDQSNAINTKADEIAHLLLPGSETFMKNNNQSSVGKAVSIDSLILKRYTGTYSSVTGFRVDLAVKNGKLFAGRAELTPTSDQYFYVSNSPEAQFRIDGENLTLTGQVAGESILLTRTGAAPTLENELREYEGAYTSDELVNTFTIRLEDGKLVMDNPRLGPSKLRLLGKDHIFSDYNLMRHMLLKRDEQGRITGFNLNDDSLMNIFFRKERR
jgi:hypothetical protein